MFLNTDVSKKAAGIVGSIIDVVKNSAGKVGQYVSKAAAFAMKHQNTIARTLDIGSQAIGIGANIGLIPQPFASVLNASNDALKDYRKHKTGGAVWNDYNTLFPLELR